MNSDIPNVNSDVATRIHISFRSSLPFLQALWMHRKNFVPEILKGSNRQVLHLCVLVFNLSFSKSWSSAGKYTVGRWAVWVG